MLIWNDEIPGLSKKSIILQISFWLLFITYEILLAETLGAKDSFASYLLHYTLYLVLFYWHCYALLFKHIQFPAVHGVGLLLGLLLEFVLFYVLNCLIHLLVNPEPGLALSEYISKKSVAAVVYRFGFVLGLSTTFWLGLATVVHRQAIQELEQLKLEDQLQKKALEIDLLQSELVFLKAQIQPHFLFNALQKIYIQLRNEAPLGAASIMQLAKLMQHQLVSDKHQKILLSSELAYAQDFITIQRAIQPIELLFLVSKRTLEQAKQVFFPPLIIATLLENIFKFAILHLPEAPALLSIDLHGNRLLIKVENKIKPGVEGGRGIGIKNLRERLRMLYPAKHVFRTQLQNDHYKLKLYIST